MQAQSDSIVAIERKEMLQTRTTMATPPKREDSCADVCGIFLWVFSVLFTILTFPLSLCFILKQVQEYERAIIFRMGQVKEGGPVGPGLFIVLPFIDQVRVVDLRTVAFNVPPQEILSKDSVTVQVDAVVYYKIYNPMDAVCNVLNTAVSTQLLASSTLRMVLGTKNLSEILSDRENTAVVISKELDKATDEWGIKVERVEVKDVKLPANLQRAMAAEAEASREARAKVITAEGELRASNVLKEAANVLSDSPAALQLRYLQTLTHISAEKHSTIIFPVPLELMGNFGTMANALGNFLGNDQKEHQESENGGGVRRRRPKQYED